MDTKQIKENIKITQKQKELFKKILAYTVMGIFCAGFIFWIYFPSGGDKKSNEQSGFNTLIPNPKERSMIDDKREAYEKDNIKKKQEERMQSLHDFSLLLRENSSENMNDLRLITDEKQPAFQSEILIEEEVIRKPAPVQNSINAYREMNGSLSNFYETPKIDPEKEKLREELEELKARIEQSESRKNETDNQLELMEKSFELASKYMPNQTTGKTETASLPENTNSSGKETHTENTKVMPVTQVKDSPVSVLRHEMSNQEFIETYSRPRNMSFLTAETEVLSEAKNTISSCINGNQTVMNGQNVKMRLLEPMRAGLIKIPRGTLLSGTSRIQGERLNILINSIEYAGTIIPVALTIYDSDGQRGISIPDIQELNAAKEIVAGMGSSAGMSISLADDAGKQFAADMGRNLIQGISGFTAKKLREVKVHLKDGYRLFLISEESLKKSSQTASNL